MVAAHARSVPRAISYTHLYRDPYGSLRTTSSSFNPAAYAASPFGIRLPTETSDANA